MVEVLDGAGERATDLGAQGVSPIGVVEREDGDVVLDVGPHRHARAPLRG
ncbi:MAG: hypothetical protein U5R31_02250 [Acidimicrobiia bacterium]|nr:hypothetical protein [Acidimicrobiia bacterium]